MTHGSKKQKGDRKLRKVPKGIVLAKGQPMSDFPELVKTIKEFLDTPPLKRESNYDAKTFEEIVEPTPTDTYERKGDVIMFDDEFMSLDFTPPKKQNIITKWLKKILG
jgi:hypothetical protein